MAKTEYKARITKRIQHLSRAINKIDPNLANKTFAVEHAIKDVRMGINDFKYTKDGVEQKIRYDQIATLPVKEQASLLQKLSTDRYELRQERALEQLKTKGKISTQFKRSIESQNKKLYENIIEMEDMLSSNQSDAIQEEFGGLDIKTGEDWFDEADSYFQANKATAELFDFYRPGEAGGFSELNAFTWNAYKVLRDV